MKKLFLLGAMVCVLGMMTRCTPEEEVQQWTVTLNHENPWWQWQDSIYQFSLSDNCVSGGGVYRSGTEITINANNENEGRYFGIFGHIGAVFSHWSDGDTNSTKNFTITNDCEYTAYYRLVPAIHWEEDFLIGKWGERGQQPNSFTLQYSTFITIILAWLGMSLTV